MDWFLGMSLTKQIRPYVPWYAILPLALITFLFLLITTRIAARLTTWEATYPRVSAAQ